MQRDINGAPVIESSVTPQRDSRTEQRTKQRQSIQRIADTHRHPMALADALESRTEALHLATLDSEQRIAAREGVYADAEALADAWLTLSDAEHEPTYRGAFTATPDDAPVHTCQTRAEWAAVWDEALQAVMHAARFNYTQRGILPAQSGQRETVTAFASRDYSDAIARLMGATSTYSLDWSDGLTVRDLSHAYRANRIKSRDGYNYTSEGEDVRYGYWRTYDRESSPLVYVRTRDDANVTLREQSEANPFAWHSVTGAGAPRAGRDGRAAERAAVAAAARKVALAAQRARQQRLNARADTHTISADLTAMLERARAGTSER